jgi:hypothetical protein
MRRFCGEWATGSAIEPPSEATYRLIFERYADTAGVVYEPSTARPSFCRNMRRSSVSARPASRVT